MSVANEAGAYRPVDDLTVRRGGATGSDGPWRLVSGESLAVARIVFGAVALLSAVRLVANGWVSTLLVEPAHHLRYPWMSWVPVPPGWALWSGVVVLAGSAVCIIIGYRFRAAMVTFWFTFTWLEFIEATIYLNHYWFMTLAGALMVSMPMAATWSVDARRRGARRVPVLAVWMLRVQVGVVYFFAGVAKLNPDWLAHGLPLALWLPARSDLPLLGPLLEWHSTALVASWAGAAFDCTIVGFLLWRRTRLAAWVIGVAFHLTTWLLFPTIGVFPWLMIGMSTLFFEPDWPTRVRGVMRKQIGWTPLAGTVGSTPDDVSAGQVCAPRATATDPPGGPGDPYPVASRLRRVILGCAALWVVLQIALPLRHFAYPGEHRWTNEGYRYAWNVMAVEKVGDLHFRVTDPATGTTRRRDATSLFTPQQLRVVRSDPELIRQAAHTLAASAAQAGGIRVEVRADAFVSLNGRPPERLIDPRVDLAGTPIRPGAQPWILPAPRSDPPL